MPLAAALGQIPTECGRALIRAQPRATPRTRPAPEPPSFLQPLPIPAVPQLLMACSPPAFQPEPCFSPRQRPKDFTLPTFSSPGLFAFFLCGVREQEPIPKPRLAFPSCGNTMKDL